VLIKRKLGVVLFCIMIGSCSGCLLDEQDGSEKEDDGDDLIPTNYTIQITLFGDADSNDGTGYTHVVVSGTAEDLAAIEDVRVNLSSPELSYLLNDPALEENNESEFFFDDKNNNSVLDTDDLFYINGTIEGASTVDAEFSLFHVPTNQTMATETL